MKAYNSGMTEIELISGIANELHNICEELRLKNNLKMTEMKANGVSEETLRNSLSP